jgi:glutathione peroxidase
MEKPMTTVYDFSATTIEGSEQSLRGYAGKVLLIVNTASECGFTPQYQELQALHERYGERGLAVLGFPCNQLGKQEPGSEEQIRSFCEVRYGVTFPLFAKIDVNGANAHPLFVHVKKSAPGLLGSKDIKWNFTKFLVDADGTVLERYASKQTPEEIEADITPLLG